MNNFRPMLASLHTGQRNMEAAVACKDQLNGTIAAPCLSSLAVAKDLETAHL